MAEKINRIQENLKSGKSFSLLEVEDILYMEKPLGKAMYVDSLIEQKRPIGRPRKEDEDKAKPNDILICNICGRTFIRSARSRHRKTKIHQAYEGINTKLAKVILNIDTDKI